MPAGWLDGFRLAGSEPGGDGDLPYSHQVWERA
jgi:hypothetical protein